MPFGFHSFFFFVIMRVIVITQSYMVHEVLADWGYKKTDAEQSVFTRQNDQCCSFDISLYNSNIRGKLKLFHHSSFVSMQLTVSMGMKSLRWVWEQRKIITCSKFITPSKHAVTSAYLVSRLNSEGKKFWNLNRTHVFQPWIYLHRDGCVCVQRYN